MPEALTPQVDLIVLAGGRGSRLGGAVKAAVDVAGRTLLSRVLDARTLARRVVVVGPASARVAAGPEAAGVLWALEDPPFGGPVAGIAAGLAALAAPSTATSAGAPADAPAEWLLVLACDLPWAADAAGTLVAALADQALADRAGRNTTGTDALDGLHLSDPDGRPQWLAGLYRASTLRDAAARLGPAANGASMRALLSGLRLVGVRDDSGSSRDVDTWQDVEWSTALLSGPSPVSTTPPRSDNP
ncbi:molybdopterin-guanine dinucleotide biosynthesis protein [Cryobacterium sp. MDB1-18-2]|uniref:molybdenum cofactor guanylyltransferase n=1 Tax=unclassified Cryobacterium TaxID=2649013 RepID=UPI00106D1081|nr:MULTISPECIES: NTP transferase domain-containing protein [unclassified Cryobacterium]TFC24946.1 molybdopterin-guanine dinucleotide biosynthesis protein [Cryobacterium sp. MDB1-18-2]TFC45712.1 molybdopterin-guanine dinucleotide biosynthesis protein [Cryobacterium sp. MDB1-18-1]